MNALAATDARHRVEHALAAYRPRPAFAGGWREHHPRGVPRVNPASNPWPVVELRQYTLHPGRRDDLVELFEREFVETQEACGMRLFGQFRDLDDTDRFVWLRGFAGMDARAAALGAFYGGPVWKAHRDAANATMIDSDDVLLLRPLRADGGFALDGATRAPVDAPATRARLVVALLWSVPLGDADVAERLERRRIGVGDPRGEYVPGAAGARERTCARLLRRVRRRRALAPPSRRTRGDRPCAAAGPAPRAGRAFAVAMNRRVARACAAVPLAHRVGR